MAIQSVVQSNAFNFVSFMQNSVDPRTGQYTLAVELPELIGNHLSGPRLPLHLGFSPMNDQDVGFGIGWSLNLSQFVITTGMLSLSTGENFRVSDNGPGQPPVIAERKLETFRLHNESNPSAGLVRYRVVHKSGLVEVLEPQQGNPNLALPVRVLAPSGHGLTLVYRSTGREVHLISVTDDTGRTLLAIDYSSNNQALITLHPRQPAEATYVLQRQGDELRQVTLPSDEKASWRFQYETSEGVRCVSHVENPLGGIEQIRYEPRGHHFPLDAQGRARYLPRVVRHTVQPMAGQPEMVTRYSYTQQNFLGFGGSGIVWTDDGSDNLYKLVSGAYSYGSTAHLLRPGVSGETQEDVEVEVRTIERRFNRFHLLTDEVTRQGDCVATVTTLYHEEPNHGFKDQPNKFQLPKEVTRSWRLNSDPSEYRQEKVTTDFDGFGNPTTELQANGVRTIYQYLEDPEGFMSLPLSQTVYPASDAQTEPGADVLRTEYDYRVLAPLSPLARGEALCERETLVQQQTGAILRQTTLAYYRSAAQRLSYGRRQLQQAEMRGLVTRIDYVYSETVMAGHLAVSTVETVTGYDHGLADEQGVSRDSRKVITTVNSALIGEPLLNRDDNDVEIAYAYDQLHRVTRETVAPGHKDYEASRVYSYQLAAAAGAPVLQTRTDVKGVTTWTYLDGIGREVREDRQDADFGLSELALKAPRYSYTVKYDALGDRVEETEYDWFERQDRALTTTFAYDDWGQQCCVTGPDGVRNHEQRALTGSRAWRTGAVVTQWREGADGTRTGSTVTFLNRFEEPHQIARLDTSGREYSKHRYFHDGLGRTAREIEARGEQTRFARDAFDRLVDHTLANGAVVHRDYALHSSEDLPTSIQVLHRDKQTTSLLGEQRFDGLDRMVESITGGRRRVMSYDPGQRQPSLVLTPSKQRIAYEYAPVLSEEPIKRALLDTNVTAKYNYDGSNARLNDCTEEQPVSGGMVAAEPQGLSRTYFSTGELRSETRTLGPAEKFDMAYVHSLRGRLLAYTDVQGQTQIYDYDAAGRLIFTKLGAISSTFTYDALGRMCRIETLDKGAARTNSLVTELEYDDFEREVLRRFIFADGSRQELRQDYNVIDGIVRKELIGIALNAVNSELLREEEFEYDSRARLEYYASHGPLSPQDPSGVTIEAQEFYLDDLDNIEEVRTWHADGRIDALYSFDNPDDPAQLTGVEMFTLRKVATQAPTAADEQPTLELVSRRAMPLSYDEDGNMTTDEAGRTLQYDALGRLAKVSGPGRDEGGSYGYDPLDRIAVQTTLGDA